MRCYWTLCCLDWTRAVAGSCFSVSFPVLLSRCDDFGRRRDQLTVCLSPLSSSWATCSSNDEDLSFISSLYSIDFPFPHPVQATRPRGLRLPPSGAQTVWDMAKVKQTGDRR